MLQHFTFQPFLSKESRRREFKFSFFHKGTYHRGIYHYNGAIDWSEPEPTEADRRELESEIHALMLFHVYDK